MKTVLRTVTIIRYGHELTLIEVPDRPRSTRIDAFGKCTTSITPQPNFDGLRNMALKKCRKLTKSEIKELQP